MNKFYNSLKKIFSLSNKEILLSRIVVSYESFYDSLRSRNRIKASKHNYIWKHQEQHAT